MGKEGIKNIRKKHKQSKAKPQRAQKNLFSLATNNETF